MKHEQLNKLVEKLLLPKGIQSFHVERIKGGGNNQSYRLDFDGSPHFLKIYHQDPEDPRRRGETEYSWLEALWKSGVRNVPRPFGFAIEEDVSAGVYEFFSGRAVDQSEVNEDRISTAIDFIEQLNKIKFSPHVQKLKPASEACFSYSEQWELIHKRIKRLNDIQNLSPTHQAAAQFVADRVVPIWTQISKKRPQDFERILTREEQVLSPSDFGFHNAIVLDSGETRFIDFEYAGWDDPAKLICDFFNQVSHPVSLEYLPRFQDAFSPINSKISERVEILMPLYQLKWICILLNHFLPADSRRKKFALQNPSEWETLLDQQLQKAKTKLENNF